MKTGIEQNLFLEPEVVIKLTHEEALFLADSLSESVGRLTIEKDRLANLCSYEIRTLAHQMICD